MCDAHKLHGWLGDFWACYLGWNIRMIYEIDEENKQIITVRIGLHNIY